MKLFLSLVSLVLLMGCYPDSTERTLQEINVKLPEGDKLISSIDSLTEAIKAMDRNQCSKLSSINLELTFIKSKLSFMDTELSSFNTSISSKLNSVEYYLTPLSSNLLRISTNLSKICSQLKYFQASIDSVISPFSIYSGLRGISTHLKQLVEQNKNLKDLKVIEKEKQKEEK